MDWAYLVKFLGALFAIMNPFLTLPMFLGFTEGMEPAAQRRRACRSLPTPPSPAPWSRSAATASWRCSASTWRTSASRAGSCCCSSRSTC
ncbi:MAG: hypothetical protein R3F59_13375 [Myxococcota bacterium]